MNIKLVGFLAGSVTLSVVAIVSSVYTTIKVKKAAKKINDSIGDISDLSETKITDRVLEKAVARAADSKVDKYMKATYDATLMAADRNLDQQARNAVEACARDIRKQASEKINKQVADLDIEALKKQVCKDAEKHVMEKLDGCLDASVKDFKNQLEYARKVRNRYAIAVEEDEEKDDGFHLVLC